MLNLNEDSLIVLDGIKAKARASWSGREGERRAERVEALLSRVLPDYAAALGYSQDDILQAFERRRDYSAINFYQDANFPLIEGLPVHDTVEAFRTLVPSRQFRCPFCKGVSTDPQTCNSGVIVDDKKCDWKSYGLFRTLGEGYRCIIKDGFLEHPVVHEIFMPIEFEAASAEQAA